MERFSLVGISVAKRAIFSKHNSKKHDRRLFLHKSIHFFIAFFIPKVVVFATKWNESSVFFDVKFQRIS